MSNRQRCKILLKILDRVLEEYLDTREFKDKFLNEIFRNEKTTLSKHFLFVLVFLAVVFFMIYGLLLKFEMVLMIIDTKHS